MEGYLKKKSPAGLSGVQTWQKRYFKVDNAKTRLYIFKEKGKSDQPKSALSVILLEKILVIDRNIDQPFRFTMEISNKPAPNRVFQLLADTATTAEQWVTFLLQYYGGRHDAQQVHSSPKGMPAPTPKASSQSGGSFSEKAAAFKAKFFRAKTPDKSPSEIRITKENSNEHDSDSEEEKDDGTPKSPRRLSASATPHHDDVAHLSLGKSEGHAHARLADITAVVMAGGLNEPATPLPPGLTHTELAKRRLSATFDTGVIITHEESVKEKLRERAEEHASRGSTAPNSPSLAASSIESTASISSASSSPPAPVNRRPSQDDSSIDKYKRRGSSPNHRRGGTYPPVSPTSASAPASASGAASAGATGPHHVAHAASAVPTGLMVNVLAATHSNSAPASASHASQAEAGMSLGSPTDQKTAVAHGSKPRKSVTFVEKQPSIIPESGKKHRGGHTEADKRSGSSSNLPAPTTQSAPVSPATDPRSLPTSPVVSPQPSPLKQRTGPLRSILRNPVDNDTLSEIRRRVTLERIINGQLLGELVKGSTMVKYSSFGKPAPRIFRVSEDGGVLTWVEPDDEKKKHSKGFFSWNRKKKAKSRYVADIMTLHYGPYSSVRFSRYLQRKDNADGKPWLCMTLDFEDRTLDIVAPDEHSVTSWFLGLQSFSPQSRYFLTKGLLLWQRLIMKINFYGLRACLHGIPGVKTVPYVVSPRTSKSPTPVGSPLVSRQPSESNLSGSSSSVSSTPSFSSTSSGHPPLHPHHQHTSSTSTSSTPETSVLGNSSVSSTLGTGLLVGAATADGGVGSSTPTESPQSSVVGGATPGGAVSSAAASASNSPTSSFIGILTVTTTPVKGRDDIPVLSRTGSSSLIALAGGKKVPTLLHAARSIFHQSKMLSYIPDAAVDTDMDGNDTGISGGSNNKSSDSNDDMPEDAEHTRTPKHVPSVTDLFGPEVATPRTTARSVASLAAAGGSTSSGEHKR